MNKMYCIWLTTSKGTTHLIDKVSDRTFAKFLLEMTRQTYPTGTAVMTEGAE